MKLLFLSLFFAATACNQQYPDLGDGMYAEFTTNKGTIVCTLEFEKTPITVANFVSLAEGTNTMVSDNYKGKMYYDGLKFHRVIADFMIQGGCPLGTGSGDPGYKFKDEFDPSLVHDKPGILSMANAGPKTNGSQFFITHKATPHLNNKHSVFGHVVVGLDIVNTIAGNDTIQSVKIIRKGSAANKFDAAKLFNGHFVAEKEIQEKAKAEMNKSIDEVSKGFEKTATGLRYKITQTNTAGKKAKRGDNIQVHYTGTLLDGTKFDSSVDRGKPISFPIGTGRVIPGWDEGIMLLKEGEKARLIIPSYLGYGERGSGRIIPPNAILIFDVELVKVGN
ncbi:MAG: peptidylprolyl isomerase [Flavobacteriaceae bacterium]|nr:peptidylprolyl isomerase [Flavobacteriaceae bacterium]